MMQPAEYRHYYCQPCADKKRATLTATSGIKIQWESVSDSMFRCGEWSDKGTIKPGQGCRAKATVELIGFGGNPVTSTTGDAKPVLHGPQPKIIGD
jgi:hypothetical protein